MEIGAFTLLERMHSNGSPSQTVLLASWHWKWSLTWRWIFAWRPGLSGRAGLYFMRVHRGSPGLNFHAGANLPLLGSFSIQTQPNMRIRA